MLNVFTKVTCLCPPDKILEISRHTNLSTICQCGVNSLVKLTALNRKGIEWILDVAIDTSYHFLGKFGPGDFGCIWDDSQALKKR